MTANVLMTSNMLSRAVAMTPTPGSLMTSMTPSSQKKVQAARLRYVITTASYRPGRPKSSGFKYGKHRHEEEGSSACPSGTGGAFSMLRPARKALPRPRWVRSPRCPHQIRKVWLDNKKEKHRH